MVEERRRVINTRKMLTGDEAKMEDSISTLSPSGGSIASGTGGSNSQVWMQSPSTISSIEITSKQVTGSPQSPVTPLPFNITGIPAVPLDRIISHLSAEDLRRFHQVSRSWKTVLVERHRDNERRLELVTFLQQNKENITNKSISQEAVTTATTYHAFRDRSNEMDKKNSVDVLMECTNNIQHNNNSTPVSNHAPGNHITYSTPTSRFDFQIFEEEEKKLQRGQKLLKCRRCSGPVPSPIMHESARESRRQSLSTRCNLSSRWKGFPEIEQGEKQEQERKKAKTLPSVDLSPIPFPPVVSIASLGKKLDQSLVLSSPCLSTSSDACLSWEVRSPEIDIQRSTSWSSITGIDFPSSSPNLNMNSFSNSPRHFEVPNNIDCSRIQCLRSCCQQSKHNSHFSDSGFSFGGSEPNTSDWYNDFINFIPSPAPASEYDSQSIEHGRYQDFSNSNGAMSCSSFQIQRTDHQISTDSLGLFPILECPNTNCRFKFCSSCEESEHPGKPCHVISADQLESTIETPKCNISASNSGSGDKREKSKDKKSRSLKRLAKLR